MANVNKSVVVAEAAAKFALATVILAKATIIDRKKLTFSATVEYPEGPDVVTATLCSANGKPKRYNYIDQLISDLSKGAPGVSHVVVDTDVDTLTPESVSLNPAAQVLASNKKWEAVKARQITLVAELDAQLAMIASYATGNSAQRAAHATLTMQRATANNYIAFANSQIAATT
jgi:hypothetical protein